MPDLGEGLEEGTIVEWLVSEGDGVALNQPLVEVETAKAAVEIPSPFAGRVVALHGSRGENVPVGAPLVTFEVEGTVEPATSEPSGPVGVRSSPPADERTASGPRATPPVRKLAKDLGVELSVIEGTGPDGRVTEDDVRAAAGGPDEDVERVPVTPARKTIAGNLERQATIPQVTTFRNVDCTSLETWRADLGVSPLPVVVAALCRTVEDHPLLNASWGGDHLRTPAAINVGLAADTERGLVVPVVRNAGAKGIAALAEEIRRLAAAAREGTLSPEELSGATIAVSNTGSYGSEAGTPILSPGTGVTLAFGAIQDRALVVDGVVVARKAATISLTFDHRVLDGAAVGRALGDLVALLESAERLEGLPR